MATPDRNELRRALERTPDDHELRLRLAGVLLGVGQADEALYHAQTVLDSEPASLHALVAAHDAAVALGDDSKAAAYRRLRDALTHAAPTVSEVEGDLVPDTADELIAVFAGSEPPTGLEIGDIEEPDVTLADVGGMESVKRRLELSFLGPLRNPALMQAYGATGRGGLLLYGPPGCGKTFIAKALAGELGASFFSVGLNDILDMWIGNSEKNLHAVFEAARAAAPCVLFFDEIDALGRKRGQLRHNGMRSTVNQLLTEMDGVDADNDGVFILGATNHPWDIDTALMRPGRFDRMVLVLPPDQVAREAILRLHFKGKPVNGVDLAGIARLTERFSGADLSLLVESATELAMSQSMEFGAVVPVGSRHVEEALRSTSPSTGPWFQTAKNYALYGDGDGRFEDLLAYISEHWS